ncbi:MAG: urease accessory protein UreD, partial [Gammaproteobacteria bacterium]
GVRARRQPHQPKGWQATLELGFQQRNNKTVLTHRKRQGPLSVQRPFYPEGSVCHVYLLHPPGGVVGGDQLNIDINVASGQALITTPGATKFYRSNGALAEQRQSLRIADGASLEWMPQENIAFPGAHASLQSCIELEGSATIAAWEIQCLGRPTNQEAFDEGSLEFQLSLYRDGDPLILERLHVDPDSLKRASLLNGNPVTGNLLISGMTKTDLETAREQLPDQHFAATLIEDILIVRYLGDSTEMARKVFTGCWTELRPRQLNRPAMKPRIWAT